MHRRSFLKNAACLVGGARELWAAAEPKQPSGDLKKFKITEVAGFRHVGPRPRLVGKNSHLDVHGAETRDNVIRIRTNQGVEGFGWAGGTTPEMARQLLAHGLDEFWQPGVGVVSPLGRADHVFFDLVGKALNMPAWKLLGGQGPEWVAVYDGGVYFNDLLPQYQQRGVGRLVEEVEESLKTGHRAFKIKVGRGFKWMEKEAGFQRDVEVLKAIRKVVGKEVKLGVDANNGFDLKTTKRWLDTLGDELYFIEEMFPEQVDQDLELKAHVKSKGWKTLVADGESAREVSHFDSYVRSDALDVLQPDMRAFGFTLEWELSRKIAAKPHIKIAPHNWGSFLGFYMQLVFARGVSNVLMAEEDRSSSDLFDASAFTFKEGKVRVPDLQGCGIILREDVFKRKYQRDAWVVTA
jgi:D-galactarolactone cycloisomerase